MGTKRYGAIEAGGTKWVCAIGDESGELVETQTLPTTTPDETIGRAAAWLGKAGPLEALGVGCFGPVDVHLSSPTWGYVTTTPKPGWANTDVAPRLGALLGTRVAFDTDVNAAAVGEQVRGAAVGLETFAYITVGTGIGAGIVVDGRVHHGLAHPEFGHMRVPHGPDDPFPGSCPFHGDCLEGLASGESLRQRWSRPAEEIDDDVAWQIEARYLAAGIVNLICTLSPQRVIIGGGVLKRPALLPLIRTHVDELLAGYVAAPEIVEPACGGDAGVLGALELARRLVSSEGGPGG